MIIYRVLIREEKTRKGNEKLKECVPAILEQLLTDQGEWETNVNECRYFSIYEESYDQSKHL